MAGLRILLQKVLEVVEEHVEKARESPGDWKEEQILTNMEI